MTLPEFFPGNSASKLRRDALIFHYVRDLVMLLKDVLQIKELRGSDEIVGVEGLIYNLGPVANYTYLGKIISYHCISKFLIYKVKELDQAISHHPV